MHGACNFNTKHVVAVSGYTNAYLHTGYCLELNNMCQTPNTYIPEQNILISPNIAIERHSVYAYPHEYTGTWV